MTGWPNFFIAGAAKAGTTALYEFVAQHPQIYLSPIKEPTFFAREDLMQRSQADVERRTARDRDALAEYLRGPMTDRHGHRLVFDEAQYLSLFRLATDQKVIGEGSVTYFWSPGAPAAIAARVPHARLVFVLRDPADRMFSQYLASVHPKPGTTFRERFTEALVPGTQWSAWVDAGRYATNLKRFYAVFPRDQIRIYLYEEFRQDAGALLRDLFGFLGVNPDQRIDTGQRVNEPAIPRFPALHALRTRVLGRGRLMNALPAWLRPLVRGIYLRKRSGVRMSPADRLFVIDALRDEIRETESLIGRDLSAWRR